MRIGLFTDTYFPQTNGVVTAIETYRRGLTKLGHEVFILYPKAPGYASKDPHIIGLRSMKFVFQPEYRYPVVITPRELYKLLGLKLDIVHSHSPFSLGFLAEFVATFQGIPHFHSYQTVFPEYVHYFPGNRVFQLKYLTKKFTALFCNRCDFIITPTEKMKREIQTYGVKHPIHVLPTGVDLSEFRNTSSKFRTRYHLKKTVPILLFVGRLGPEKNLDFLLKSFKHVLDRSPEARLVIVGDGPSRKSLERSMKTLHLEHSIIFTGYLDRRKTLEAFHESDIFTFPSVTEAQGLVVLEAAASNLPIVTVKDSAYKDTVIDGFNGFQAEDSVIDFARRIVEILEDESLKKKMRIHSFKIAQRFAIEAQAAQLTAWYREGVKHSKKNPLLPLRFP